MREGKGKEEVVGPDRKSLQLHVYLFEKKIEKKKRRRAEKKKKRLTMFCIQIIEIL